jgi:hypothetical protein
MAEDNGGHIRFAALEEEQDGAEPPAANDSDGEPYVPPAAEEEMEGEEDDQVSESELDVAGVAAGLRATKATQRRSNVTQKVSSKKKKKKGTVRFHQGAHSLGLAVPPKRFRGVGDCGAGRQEQSGLRREVPKLDDAVEGGAGVVACTGGC